MGSILDDPRKLPPEIREKYPVFHVPSLVEEVKAINRNIDAMELQLKRERERLIEWKILINKCQERDEKLKELGYEV